MTKIFFYICTLFLIAPYCSAMESFNSLEKQLIEREMSRSGSSSINSQIKRGSLRVMETFFKQDSKSDSFIKTIFNAIEEIESENGYSPTPIEIRDGHYSRIIPAKNYLGTHTQYFWNGTDTRNVVTVTLTFKHNKENVNEHLQHRHFRKK